MNITIDKINKLKANVQAKQLEKATAQGNLQAALDNLKLVAGTDDIEIAKQALVKLEDKEEALQLTLNEKLQELENKYGNLLC